jgi:hypothetical protein
VLVTLHRLSTQVLTNGDTDSLMLHYHLSILLLVDIIEATDRYDLLVGLTEAKTDAENAVVNTLAFGLHNTFTLSVKSESTPASLNDHGGSDFAVTVPIVSIDPYPHHVVAGVQLIRKAIDRDFGLGKITEASYANLQSTLERTLSHLPQSSKSVQAARTKTTSASPAVPDGALSQHQDPYAVLQAPYSENR